MGLDNKTTIKAIEKALRLISKLSEEELDSIVSGEIEFKTSIVKKRIKVISVKDEICEWQNEKEILNRVSTRQEAKAYLLSLKLTNKKLNDLGKSLLISVASKSKKDEIINIIVESTVGSRLKIDALKNGMI
ncbi:MAG: hypothetical protein ACRC68_14740 [Clostridium sp.]